MMKRLIIPSLFALIVTVLHLVAELSSFGARLEPRAIDLWSNIRGPVTPPNDILILTMDEASYKNLNISLTQAWPRSVHAQLLKRLAELKARKVIFDILFIDKGLDSRSDEAFADAVGKLPTVLGADTLIRDYSSTGGSYKVEELLLPFKSFMENAQVGLVSLPEDFGYIRRFLTERTSKTVDLPSLAEAAVSEEKDPSIAPQPRDFINYYGGAGTIPSIHYFQILDLQNPVSAELVKDKIVFVGLVLRNDIGPSQKDIFMTPYGNLFGTEIHATSALNILHQQWIRRAPIWVEIVALSAAAFLITTLFFLVRPLWGAALLLFTVLGWSVLSYSYFLKGFFVPGTILVIFFFPLSLLLSSLYFYLVTRRSELDLAHAWERYVSPDAAMAIVSNQKSLLPDGTTVPCTVLVTNIENFALWSQQKPGAEIHSLLSQYLHLVSSVIFRNNGTVIKFIGDKIIAVWGAPFPLKDHCEKACLGALEIQQTFGNMKELKNIPGFKIRIGIHTGPLIVGNFGDHKNIEYSAIGETVELTSTIEEFNKSLGTSILISSAVKEHMPPTLNTLTAGVTKSGMSGQTITLHMLLTEDIPVQMRNSWERALIKFKMREWIESKKLFLECSNSTILTGAATLYLKMIDHYLIEPPSLEWQGEISGIN